MAQQGNEPGIDSVIQRLTLDPQVEVSPALERREFMGRFLKGVALGSIGSSAYAAGLTRMPEGAKADDEAYWRYVAQQFMLKPGVSYLNTGTRGPSPRMVYQAQVDSIAAADRDRLGYAKNVYNSERKSAIRQKLASFVGCDIDEVAFTNNTTAGMAIGTSGPDLKTGDEIIFTNHDHSSGAQPIHLRSARYGTVPVVVDLSAPEFHPPRGPGQIVDAIEASITPRTRLISICHVNYTDGCVMPVKEICELARSRGILTLIDGAHPPGMLELDLHDVGCDMYAGACHKWMMAGQLTGFFYVRKEVQEQIWPLAYSGPVNGLTMYGSEAENDPWNSAEKYEKHGSINYASGISVEASIDFLNSIGIQHVEKRDRQLAANTRQALGEINGVELLVSEDPRLCAGLVAFRIKGIEPKFLTDELWSRHQIYIRNVTHEEIDWDANRVSLHLMATQQDVDRLIGAVDELVREAKI